MFRKFIAIITICAISFVFLVNPVRAESIPINLTNQSNSSMINHGQLPNNDDIWSPVVETLNTGANIVEIVTFGAAAVCIISDLAGTAVFPPAAVLLPYCPTIGAVGGGSATLKGVKGVKPAKYLLRNAF